MTDNWDGTYSAPIERKGDAWPKLVATYRDAGGALAFVPLPASPGTTLRVVVKLLELAYERITESVPLPTTAVVLAAPNATFPRSVARKIGLAGLRAGEALAFADAPVIFDGHVEEGATMLLAIGDAELDFFSAFDDGSTAAIRMVPLKHGSCETASVGEAGAVWKARVAVEAQRAGRTLAPDASVTEGRKRKSAV